MKENNGSMVFVENINKKTDSFNIVDSEFNEDTQ